MSTATQSGEKSVGAVMRELSAASKMTAWVVKRPREPMVLETVDAGPLGAEEVEVAVEHCGVCHSDVSVLNNEWGISQYPAVLGHEVVGRITASRRVTRSRRRPSIIR